MLITFLPPAIAAVYLAYLNGRTDSQGNTRLFKPKALGGSPERFLAAVANSTVPQPFVAPVFSNWEGYGWPASEQMGRDEAEVSELLRGGLPECRLPRAAVGHLRVEGSDGHILQSKLDLLTHMEVPIWRNTAGEKRLNNIRCRLTNLEGDRYCAGDRWHLPFRLEAPAGLSAWEKQDFRSANLNHIMMAGDGEITAREDIVSDLWLRGYKDPTCDDEGIEVTTPGGSRVRYEEGIYADGFEFRRVREARQRERREIRRLRRKLRQLKGARCMEFARRFGTGSFSVSRPILGRLLAAYGVSPAEAEAEIRRFKEHPMQKDRAGFAALYRPESTKPNHHGNQPTELKHGAILRINTERRLFAESLGREAAIVASRIVAENRGAGTTDLRAGPTHSRTEELAAGRARDLGRLLEGARNLQESAGAIGDQAGGRETGAGLRRNLEHARGGCERARGAVAAHLMLAAQRERILNPPPVSRKLPTPQANLNQGFGHGR